MLSDEILLIRHARPRFDTRARVRTSDMRDFLAAYESAGIDHRHTDPRTRKTKTYCSDAKGGECRILTSNSRRSIESARLFFPHIEETTGDPLYREAELPARIPVPGLSLPYSVAVAIARSLWMLGLHQQVESYAMARARARRAAERLADSATEGGRVVLVGHGFFNRLIGRQLKRAGWTRAHNEGNGYGASTRFVRRAVTRSS